jgi:RING finger protein 121
MFQLTCKHIFHRTCLAGWCVVGKKGVCPCCSERVEMGAVYSQDSPLLGKTSALFGQALDACRYLVVFNPIIFAALRVFLILTGTMRDIEEHAKAGGHAGHAGHAGHGH